MIKIVNQTATAEIYISGDIVDDAEGNIAREFFQSTDGFEFPRELKRQLDEVKDKDLTIYINSYGGSVQAGIAMANMISRHNGHTTAIVDGFCCSIATQIFFSADSCKMNRNAYLMIHKPTVEINGNADELRKAAETLDTIQRGLESVYQQKKIAGVTDAEITEMMNNETWLNSNEAIQYFDIELINSAVMKNCAGNLNKLKSLNFKNIPSKLKFEDETIQKIEISLALAEGAIIE